MPITVYIDDNYHYMDSHERVTVEGFASFEDAVNYCRSIVDEFLEAEYYPGISAAKLLDQYKSFGEDPWISASEPNADTGPNPGFSAWDYAVIRCGRMCGS
jgi:hypothetical protein